MITREDEKQFWKAQIERMKQTIPDSIVYKILPKEDNMTVDLSTLKVGDSIKLRNGDVHKVTKVEAVNIRAGKDAFSITTETLRILSEKDRDDEAVHYQNGRWGIVNEYLGDIVEIIPAEENVAAGVEHSINWLEKEIDSPILMTVGPAKWDFGPKEENVAKRVNHSINRLGKEVDKINNPSHYQSENGKQLWDLMPDMGTKEEFLGYCKFNVIKYVNRYNKKNGIEDLRKAIKYCERMVEFLENGK